MKIAVLISGAGRTLKNFIDRAAEGSLPVSVRLVISSNPNAGGLRFAEEAGIPALVVQRKEFESDQAFGDAIFDRCREAQVDYVAMAGFLKLAPVPSDFAGRVVNIHPALIPAFCGQGMYGMRVHQAALDFGAKVTGVTVHFVDNEYDHGPILWQQPVPIFQDDTAETLADRVFQVEQECYPHVLKLLAEGKVRQEGRNVTILRRSQQEK